MKNTLLVFFLLWGAAAHGQAGVVDLSASGSSPKRKAILDALRAAIGKDLRQEVTFVVQHLKLKDGAAFYRGTVKRKDGGEIDFSKIAAYQSLMQDGVFDGPGTWPC